MYVCTHLHVYGTLAVHALMNALTDFGGERGNYCFCSVPRTQAAVETSSRSFLIGASNGVVPGARSSLAPVTPREEGGTKGADHLWQAKGLATDEGEAGVL